MRICPVGPTIALGRNQGVVEGTGVDHGSERGDAGEIAIGRHEVRGAGHREQRTSEPPQIRPGEGAMTSASCASPGQLAMAAASACAASTL
jgi:hypothetical protein